MQAKTLFQAGLLILLALSPAAFARDVIHTFKANDKKYEIYVGYGDSVYVTYGGSTDTKYEKGPAGRGCDWKYYGRCVSYSEMISKIQSRVRNHDY